MMPPMMPPVHLQRGAEHLHALGTRALAEFLLELGKRTGKNAEIAALLAEYRRLDPALVAGVLAAFANSRTFPPTLSSLECAA